MVTDTHSSTSFGSALTATGATSALAIGDDPGCRAIDSTILIVASSVTSGGIIRLERKNPGEDSYKPFARFAITADGNYCVPAWGGKGGRGNGCPDSTVRVFLEQRTDGTYTCTLKKLTKG